MTDLSVLSKGLNRLLSFSGLSATPARTNKTAPVVIEHEPDAAQTEAENDETLSSNVEVEHSDSLNDKQADMTRILPFALLGDDSYEIPPSPTRTARRTAVSIQGKFIPWNAATMRGRLTSSLAARPQCPDQPLRCRWQKLVCGSCRR
jgi:hypothetical protein